MANRLFLTLLALLTGLAAQIAPTQAHVCAQQTATAALPTPIVTRVAAAPAGLARLPEPGRRNARRVAIQGTGFFLQAWRVPSVHIQVDRARE